MALDGPLPLRHHQASAAVVGLVSGQRPAFQSRRRRKGLHGGSRLIGIGNAVISPEIIQLAVQGIVVHARKRRLIDHVGQYRAVLLHHILADQRVRIERIVQVKIRITRHRKDLAAVHLHDDAAHVSGAVPFPHRVLVGIIKFLKLLFHNTLDIHIQRADQILAVHSGLRRTLQVGVVVHIAVLPAVYAAEHVVVIFLQPVGALVVAADEADHIAGERSEGIASAVFLLKPDALNIFPCLLIRLQLLKGGDLIVGTLLFYHIILGIRVIRVVASDFPFVRAETGNQSGNGRLQVFLLFVHQLAVKDHIVNLFAHSQLRPLAVGDLSPLIGKGAAGILLLGKHLLFILLPVVPVDQKKAGA